MHIEYDIAACLIFIGMIWIINTHYSIFEKKNKQFRIFLYSALVTAFLDLLGAILINYSKVVDPTINMVVNSLYFIGIIATYYSLSIYLFGEEMDSFKKNMKNVNTFLLFVYLVFIVSNPFTKAIFSITDNGYVHGPYYLIVYLIPFYYMLNIPVLLHHESYRLTKRKIINWTIFMIILSVSTLLQLILGDILLIYIGLALGTLVVMFTLETPDYKQLTYLQENLEKEVQKQTKIAAGRQLKLEAMSIQVINALVQSIDAKDEYTNGHSTRVSEYSELLAKHLGWNEEDVANIKHAALVHDIGKIGIPDIVLNKPGRLTDEEYDVIKQHSIIGDSILMNVASIPWAAQVARYHHERYDGKGYPDGLIGEEIPLCARLVCICDAYDAMSSKRIYRNNLTKSEIRKELIKGKGTQFDPDLLEVFLNLFEKNELIIEHPFSLPEWNRTISSVDELDKITGLLKRKDGIKQAKEWIIHHDGCVAIIDVDNLKIYNNLYGNKQGDNVLRIVGKVIQSFNPIISFREGGDSFVMITNDSNANDAKRHFRKLLTEYNMNKEANMSEVTISAGLCLFNNGDNYNEIVLNADKALFYVKETSKSDIYLYDKNYRKTEISNEIDLNHVITDQGTINDDINPILQQLGIDYSSNQVAVMISLSEEGTFTVEEIENVMKLLEECINDLIRKDDKYVQYSNMQFLLLLNNTTEEISRVIVNRILVKFFGTANAKGIVPTYAVKELRKKEN